MRKFFEFQFYEDEWERRVIRFYPKTTHVHGFDDDPPKTWGKVYKTYLSFSVLHFDMESGKAHVAYNARWDECSGLNDLAYWLEHPGANTEPVFHMRVFGDATQWVVLPWGESFKLVTMYPLHAGKSYVFWLKNDQIPEFVKVITEYLDYSLAHSEGI